MTRFIMLAILGLACVPRPGFAGAEQLTCRLALDPVSKDDLLRLIPGQAGCH